MSNLVKGKNIIISMFLIDTWYPVFCAKTASLERVTEEIEVTSITSGADKEYIPGMRSTILNVTGVTTLNNTNNRISVFYLDQQSRVVHQLRMAITDNDGNSIAINFNAIVTRIGVTRDVPSYSQSQVDLRISGPVSYGAIIPAPDPEDLFSDYWNTTPAATSVTGLSVVHGYNLIDIIPLAVYREGVEYDLVSGSPGNRQARYVTPAVHFQDAFNSGEIVFIVFAR